MHCGKPLKDGTAEYCADCRRRKSYITQGKSLFLHKDPVPGAVYRFKYRNRRSYGVQFAEKMAQRYGEQIKRWRIAEIVPVPLHASRKRKRGYNQAEILAEQLSMLTGIPVRSDVLFRIKNTVPQKKLGNEEREKNISGAFAVSRGWNAPENVLLIDDIYTTGSTLEHAAKMVRRAGAENVYFLTISIGQGI